MGKLDLGWGSSRRTGGTHEEGRQDCARQAGSRSVASGDTRGSRRYRPLMKNTWRIGRLRNFGRSRRAWAGTAAGADPWWASRVVEDRR